MARDPRDIEDLIDAVAQRAAGMPGRCPPASPSRDGGSSDQLAMARVMVTMAAKGSADTARRVTAGRERWAGQSYQGGARPYGYRPDPTAPEHRKTLIVVPAQAKVIKDAAEDILKRGIPLKAIARDLRDRREPTVTGTQWTASTLRDILAKPAVAGIAVHTRAVRMRRPARSARSPRSTRAPWPPILKLEQWGQLRHLFDSRKTGTSPEPRWLVSGYADARAVRRGSEMHRVGRPPRLHLHRPRPRPPERRRGGQARPRRRGGADLRPTRPRRCSRRPGPGSMPGAKRAEAKRLDAKAERLTAMFTDDAITEAQYASGTKDIRARLAVIAAQLAAASAPDPLPEFRQGKPPPRSGTRWCCPPPPRRGQGADDRHDPARAAEGPRVRPGLARHHPAGLTRSR